MKLFRFNLLVVLLFSVLANCNEDEPQKNKITLAVLTTESITSFGTNNAVVGGNITDDGGAPVTERGVYYGTTNSPETNGTKKVMGNGKGLFSETIENLVANTKYYVKAYAINSTGTAYGALQSFTTLALPATVPVVETTTVTSYTASLAVVGGTVISDGGATVTERGVYFGTESNPETSGEKLIIGSSTGQFSEVIIDLRANTKYYVKAYAINSVGNGFGAEKTFTTPQTLPDVTTMEVTKVTDVSAFISGEVEPWGGTNITERGVYVSLAPASETSGTKHSIGSGIGEYAQEITGLAADTKYYYRAYAINSSGRGLGQELTFSTAGGSAGCYACEKGTFADSRDNKEYDWVKIGSQYWMAENLAWLPAVSPASQSSVSAPVYYVYGYNGNDVNAAKATENYTKYGVLYNWLAAMNGASGSDNNPSGVKGVCPNGWHMPSNKEWEQLAYYIGGSEGAGIKLKDDTAWGSNSNADNSSGFTALPAGSSIMGNFVGAGSSFGGTYFWTSTAYGSGWAWFKRLDSSDDLLYSGQFTIDPGSSVRCVKD